MKSLLQPKNQNTIEKVWSDLQGGHTLSSLNQRSGRNLKLGTEVDSGENCKQIQEGLVHEVR